MSEHGYESNESHDYLVRCLNSAPGPNIKCLNIEGDGGRRKTAFASALAHALEPTHVLYHDFTQDEPVLPSNTLKTAEDNEGPDEPPVLLFDRMMSDVCAYSEGEKTILIIDQLHAADFKDHIRIYKFLTTREWRYSDAAFYANRKNLMVFIVSEEPLYHSLQKNSFRVWISGPRARGVPFKPTDFKLDADAEPLIAGLHQLFENLNMFPTFSEYKKIVHDIQINIRCVDDLKQSIYGWTEAADRELLNSPELNTYLTEFMPVIEDFIGIEESVEISQTPNLDNQQ